MKYDIIIVLCPWIIVGGEFPQFLNGKYLGGQIRMDAACRIFEKNNGTKFVLTGGYNEKNGGRSDKVRDMRKFLEEKCPGIQIIECPSLPCTRHNLIAIFNTWTKEDTDVIDKKIGLLTNFYHLPRALRFWGELVNSEGFKNIPVPIPISAESVIDLSGDTYIRFIEYLLTLDGEIRGLGDNEKGAYNDKCVSDRGLDSFREIVQQRPEILLTNEERKELAKRGIL
ncbi:MAG: YdcF family protein [bacterium]|nr:YdcF family protein [bacterium]